MKKIFLYLVLVSALLALIIGYFAFTSTTKFTSKSTTFIIDNINKQQISNLLVEKNIISNKTVFLWIGNAVGIWEKIKPGKYEVKKGESIIGIIKMLKNGRLAESKLVINKLRVKEDFAKLVSKNFSTDSVTVMQFLTSTDSLKMYAVDTNTVFTLFIPDTYAFYWNTPLRKIMNKLNEAKNNFWNNNNRLEKSKAIGLSPENIYILASIVEEETNYKEDRAKIASVYINRLHKNMPLQACPTIKYAMKDFALTRIYEKYLVNPSPYNTYRVKGLPPGPICTPSPKCIDLVLNAPQTDYLFFVANANFDGYHHFSTNYAEHNKYAIEYQKALDLYTAKKKEKNSK
ncbi:MAG TPA: endolytic transglycosylase MltG [Chitinophagaceae bacterium]|nr:endolytic transglycosylase MltG [Chitinophagaceae bacterium]MCC6635269.1 endolytic transglycosylase MltG [Chitinophagaceae bacterium]HMZ46456.1 endolytic transglycosylase MltG [Chitinophagaceae bacterium]HNE93719.1 endolytic transglycosylase MltG [Chitinophagaceae bacterium]HNF29265.1 endolytic transglycosylase MltG [Chitinophagaceae bacterium]